MYVILVAIQTSNRGAVGKSEGGCRGEIRSVFRRVTSFDNIVLHTTV